MLKRGFIVQIGSLEGVFYDTNGLAVTTRVVVGAPEARCVVVSIILSGTCRQDGH